MADNPTQQDPNHHGIKINLIRELFRILPIVGAAVLLLAGDKGNMSVIFLMMGMLLMICATSHLLRKVLFPYLDLKLFVDKALSEASSAGMVFLGMSFILGMMIYSAAGLLK